MTGLNAYSKGIKYADLVDQPNTRLMTRLWLCAIVLGVFLQFRSRTLPGLSLHRGEASIRIADLWLTRPDIISPKTRQPRQPRQPSAQVYRS
jgi:hypothetical protein